MFSPRRYFVDSSSVTNSSRETSEDTFEGCAAPSRKKREVLPRWIDEKSRTSMEEADSFEAKLAIELTCYVQWLSLTPEEILRRNRAWARAELLVKQLWPECKLHLFGSFMTSLSLHTSDLDFLITDLPDNSPAEVLHDLHMLLNRSQLSYSSRFCDTATVPIVEWVDGITLIKMDFNLHPGGQKSSNFIQDTLPNYPLLRPLVLLVKHLLVEHKNHKTWCGGVSSFMAFAMCLWFLQSPYSPDHQNMASVFLGFLDYFGSTHDYENTGCGFDPPGSTYSKAERGWVRGEKISRFSIENPMSSKVDIGFKAFDFRRVRKCFVATRTAFSKVESSESGKLSVLQKVFRFSPRLRPEAEDLKLRSPISEPSPPPHLPNEFREAEERRMKWLLPNLTVVGRKTPSRHSEESSTH